MIYINERYVLQLFGDGAYLFDTLNDYSSIKLNGTETEILRRINSLHDVESVWAAIKSDYNIQDDSSRAHEVFNNYISRLESQGIIVYNDCKTVGSSIPIMGTQGKCYPIKATIELTNKCNFRCTHCYKEAEARNNTFIDTALLLKILDDFNGNVRKIGFTGGEATLHPDFEKIVKEAGKNKQYELMLLTNGSNIVDLSDETLGYIDSIQISLYGINKDEYAHYARSCEFDRVIAGIKRIAGIERLADKAYIALILRQDNCRRIDEYISFIRSLGIRNINLGITQSLGRNDTACSEWTLSLDEISEFEDILKPLYEKYNDMNFFGFSKTKRYKPIINEPDGEHYTHFDCDAGVHNIDITENGNVKPCVSLPSEFFEKYSYKQYHDIIEAGHTADFCNCICCLENDLLQKGQSVKDKYPECFK